MDHIALFIWQIGGGRIDPLPINQDRLNAVEGKAGINRIIGHHILFGMPFTCQCRLIQQVAGCAINAHPKALGKGLVLGYAFFGHD